MAMATSGSVIQLQRGDILYREGDGNDAAYIIAKGEVILHRQVDGERLDIEIRGEGAVIGEFSILTESPRTVTVEAQTDCQILRLPADKIFERFVKYFCFNYIFFKIISIILSSSSSWN